MNVVEQVGKVRTRLVQDEAPAEPYDDGGSPIVEIRPSGHGWRAEQVTSTSYRLPYNVEEAAARWGGSDPDVFERYLRIYHGVTAVRWYEERDCSYVSFDPAHWRLAMGLTPEYLAGHPDISLVDMDEWIAYLEGDCWAVVVEEEVTWTSEGWDEKTTWETVDSCYGHYGQRYAEEAAREALKDYIERSAS